MTFASANRRPNPAALAGALGIPGAFGALLVVGLAVTVVTVPKTPNPEARNIPEIFLPPPPPTPEPAQTDRKAETTSVTPIPDAPARPPVNPPFVFDGPVDFPTGPVGTGSDTGTGLIDLGIPGPAPSASPFDPVGARPTGNQGRWVTNEDYRPRWIMEEMAGRAAFTLTIDGRGRVTGCTITRSTGHAPLDAATCNLVTKRARFDAARDSNGKPVAGSYSGSVTWRIPE